MKRVIWLFRLIVFVISGSLVMAAPSEVRLASNGEAHVDVVVSEGASERVRDAANELAQQLERISGAAFDVTTGDGRVGLAVGTYRDFPDLGLEDRFDPDEPTRQEEYVLRTNERGAWLVGVTELAVEHAVWDLLYRLGFRQFFPGPTWEVVPELDELRLAVDTFEAPDFYQRTMGVGHGLMSENRPWHDQWRDRNRFRSALSISSSHAYGSIIRANQEAFDENPEYRALVGGERRGSKFCIANDDLRRLVVDHAVRQFHDDPERQSISMEPSDGGNWCECEPCAEMGSVSDRVVILANKVAEAINDLGYGAKYVGLLAYHIHSPPPTIDVHPNIVVRAASNAVRGGYTHQEIIEGWQARGATTGVSEFYSVFVWDSSMPGRQKASDMPYIRESLTRFHRAGARYFNVAVSDNWGAAGLGAYITARILWDISEADRIDELFDDFLERAFGDAREPMEGFYRLINRIGSDDRRPLMRSDMIARMYRYIDEARKLTSEPDVQARLDDLLLLTRYAELFDIYQAAGGNARQNAVNDVLRHGYRMRDTRMVHTRPILAHLARRDRQVEQVDTETVADDTPFTREELDRILREGIKNTEVVDLPFEPVWFSEDLVPARPLGLEAFSKGSFGNPPRGRNEYYLWLDEPGAVRLQATGGHITHYRHLAGPANIALHAADNPVEEPIAIEDETVLPDGETYHVLLSTPYANLHRLEAQQSSNRVHIDTVEPDQPFTVQIGNEEHFRFGHIWTMNFYVPKGTQVVGGFAANQAGSLRDGNGKTVFSFDEIETPGYFHVQVPEGQDGRIWQLHRVRGQRQLMTVPPYAARSAGELLLPREVVETDAAQ